MGNILSWTGLAYADLVFLALIFLAWPLAGEFGKPKKDDPDAPKIRPLDVYNSSMIMLWATALPILIGWAMLARPWAALGFVYEPGPKTTGAFIVVAAILAYSLVQLIRTALSTKLRAHLRAQLKTLKDTIHLMPRNGKEYRRAMMMSVTAGFTEEVIFRGYLIWALSQFMPLAAAAAIAIVHFVFLHRYQGWRGMRQVLLITTTLTALFLVTGSLIASIVLHVFIDIINISRFAIALHGVDDDEVFEAA